MDLYLRFSLSHIFYRPISIRWVIWSVLRRPSSLSQAFLFWYPFEAGSAWEPSLTFFSPVPLYCVLNPQPGRVIMCGRKNMLVDYAPGSKTMARMDIINKVVQEHKRPKYGRSVSTPPDKERIDDDDECDDDNEDYYDDDKWVSPIFISKNLAYPKAS